jgi:hypothetical protein
MDSMNYLEIIPDEILCMITAYISAPYSYIFIMMICKDFALILAASTMSVDKPLQKLCEVAAKDGHLKMLIRARQNGCPWNSNTCANAVLNGRLKTLI